MLLKTWFWALPMAVMTIGLPTAVGAQSLPAADIDSVAPAAALETPPSTASAPTFSQLSAPATTKRTASTAAAAPLPVDGDREALWLPLAGLAALAFVARRNRRAFGPSGRQPEST